MKLILGSEQLGGIDWGRYSMKECQKAFLKAIDLGINKIDTANIYGLGTAERSIRKILGKKIYKVKIITKIGLSQFKIKDSKRAKIKIDLNKTALEKNIKSSLKNLNVDYLNTCLIHWPDENIDYQETLDLLKDFRKKGYIKYFGFSNYEKIIDKKDVNKVHHLQLKFNLISNDNFNFINKFSKRVEISTYGILAHGFLTGKYNLNHKFDHTDRRHRLIEFKKDFLKKNRNKLNFLKKCANDLDLPLSSLCLAMTSNLIKNSNIIVGFKNTDQIIKNIDSLKTQLPKEIISQYKKLFL
jgi:myo-inositol catabolism protein IolS